MSKAPKSTAKAKTGNKKKPDQTKARASKAKKAQAPITPPETEKAAPEPAAEAEDDIYQEIEPPVGLPLKPRAKQPSAAIMGLAILAVLGIGGYASWPYWSYAVAPYLPAGQAGPAPAVEKTAKIFNEQLAAERRQLRLSLDRLMVRMGNIERAVENVKKLAQATTPPSEKMADDAALKALAGRLDEIEENGAAMKTLLNRMDRMEENSAAHAAAEAQASVIGAEAGSPQDTAALVLVLAVSNLRQVLTTNDPFEKALDALRVLAGDNPDIKAAVVLLAKSAATGIPTRPALNQRFVAIAGKIVQASRVAKETGWLDRVGNRLASLATWRRIDGKGKNFPIDAMVAAAESELMAGDLKAAVTTVGRISVNAKA
ncbi:MAG: hypothetical protein JKY68_03280, partial [Rhodospirillales bacterium]|nr:hypothetical protein [Rhodospirillales bacterium]